ncbi:MAG: chorismate-binding protein [Clostridia bacterium]|nr:chorismate-binding protein [Clostridia bacterium]
MVKSKIGEALKARGDGYTIFPVIGELESCAVPPINAYKRMKGDGTSFLFESRVGNERQAHYSFIGVDPVAQIFVSDGKVVITEDEIRTVTTSDPDGAIRGFMSRFKSPECDVPFSGGLAGYFSFEYFKYGQKIEMPASDLGDAHLYLFNEIIVYDNPRRKIFIIVNMDLDGNIGEKFLNAQRRIEETESRLICGKEGETEDLEMLSGFSAVYSKEEYCRKVETAKKYIKEGDIFQCVPADRWEAKARGSLFPAYLTMREKNPSPYMIYLRTNALEIAGASPETLVKKIGDTVETFPIAGTRPRGRDEEEDLALEKELKGSAKENAEHDMLVDLGRNDLGKICRFGTVDVVGYKDIFRFSHVMHMTSRVRGTLQEGKGAIDTLRATLPAGTLSGAPKRRAVEIIRELEDYTPRGIYGGAVGYISFSGDSDFCIAIRTAVKKGDRITVSAGGGVVDGSVPEEEYNEAANKAATVRDVILSSAKEGRK